MYIIYYFEQLLTTLFGTNLIASFTSANLKLQSLLYI